MKKNKSIKSKKIIFVTLLMLVIATIILGIFLSNNSMAAASCGRCGEYATLSAGGDAGHIINCQNVECPFYNNPQTVNHTWGTPVCTPQSKRYTSKRNSMYSMWLCKNRKPN